jgi:NitT/TauT family transport system substrate-binding protein
MNPALLLRALTAQALIGRALTGLVAAWLLASPAFAQSAAQSTAGGQLDKVSFGTNWVAEAEHGGFFQAVADGTYKKFGLDVTIVSVAAVFQKDPQVLLTHPELNATKLEDLKPLTLFVSKEGITTYFQWLRSEYGFNEKNVRPYNFNPQPFIATPKSAMQGYVTSEPFSVEKSAGWKPTVFLLSDYGYNSYSTLIETRQDMIDKKPDLVQRFVDASMIGWYNYLYGDNAAANAMIKKLNPEMTDELLAYSIKTMKDYGIVDSGDSLKNGLGTMTDERVASFFEKMVRAGVVRSDIDYRKSYTLRFVNKGVGLDLRPKN